MKKCVRCDKLKPDFHFAWKMKAKKKRAGECRACHKDMRRDHYERNKAKERKRIVDRKLAIKSWYKALKSTLACEKCGENHPATLQFHHDGDKEIEVSVALNRGWSVERIKKEIAKCSVLCANCHLKHHFLDVRKMV